LKVTGTRIVIHTSVPYAQIHNEGGTITKTASIRKYTRKGGRVKAHTRKGEKVKSHRRESAEVEAHSRKMNTKIPKRQFMGESKKVAKDLENYLEKEFLEIFK